MNKEGKSCVIYVRVSTEMQVDGYSLDGQKNILNHYAEREGLIIKETYEDAGKSGKSIEGRPAFTKMIKDIEEGLKVDYVLVYKLSRFGRNAADILTTLEFLQSYDVNLISTNEGLDSSQAMGKVFISLLSSMSELERENIIEQTMNGRREKARQGGWNGGFAPYGYKLVNGELVIDEEEANTIKKIFEMYANTNKGLNGVASELNLLHVEKKQRQNGTLTLWTSSLIKRILDNPVYVGKLAYGRRKREKIKGTKNDYHMVYQSDYILENGKQEAIIDQETWDKVRYKRKETGIASVPTIGHNRIHLLSGLLKCPVCGKSLHITKNNYINNNGEKDARFYYSCHNSRYAKGVECNYRRLIKKEFIEPYVIELLNLLINDPTFAKAIKDKISTKIDTAKIEEEIEGYRASLKLTMQNKNRLEHEIDTLPLDIKHRDEMISDMNSRLYSMYDTIDEIQTKIDNAKERIEVSNNEGITLENVYSILGNFNMLFNVIDDKEKKQLLKYLFKSIEIFDDFDDVNLIKKVELNFKIYNESITNMLSPDSSVNELVDKRTKGDFIISFELNGEFRQKLYNKVVIKKAEAPVIVKAKRKNKTKMATYAQIKDYIMQKYNTKVHTAYIAEVKRLHGVSMQSNRLQDDSKAKHPTSEMILKIEDALKHFNII